MKDIAPTVGRIVYYKSRGSADGKFPSVDRAAVITDVMEKIEDSHGNKLESPLYSVRVTVFNPEGLFFSDWLNQGQQGGDWDWMPFQKAHQNSALLPDKEEADEAAVADSK